MITQRTLLNQIEIAEGVTQVRLELCAFNDEAKIASRWHRTAIDNVVDPVVQMGAVNFHLAEMGEQLVSDADIDKIRRFNDLRKEVESQ